MALGDLSRRSLFAAGAAAFAAPRRPLNVVFVLADDLGWADLACYGADLHETPHLDRLASQGVRFTNACSAAPVCSPTRASIATGLHPARLHMTIWREASLAPPGGRKLAAPATVHDLPQNLTTSAEAFRQAGYFTAHAGKWHLGGAENYPEQHGFDVNIGGSLWGAPQTYFYPYRGNRHFGGEPRYVPGLGLGKPGEYLTDRLTTEALKLIEASAAKPFFLSLNFHNPHTPIEAKAALVERYKAKLRPGLNHRNATYAAMIHSLDENIGRLTRRLDELKLAANTLLVFTSDNGGFIGKNQGETVTSNAPLRSGKGSLYEGGIRVPLIVRGPGVRAGSVCHEPVISCDLYPTLLAAAGVKFEATPDALDMAPLLSAPNARLNRERLFFHYPHYYDTTTPVSAVRERKWKLLEYHEDGRIELYNLAEDPAETRDQSAGRPEVAASLLAALRAWRKQVGAQMPTRA